MFLYIYFFYKFIIKDSVLIIQAEKLTGTTKTTREEKQ